MKNCGFADSWCLYKAHWYTSACKTISYGSYCTPISPHLRSFRCFDLDTELATANNYNAHSNDINAAIRTYV